MKKARSLRELLILLKRFILKDKCFEGLCKSANDLERFNKITSEEETRLVLFIYDNKPKPKNYYFYHAIGYFWEPRVKAPRFRWLNKYINELKI